MLFYIDNAQSAAIIVTRQAAKFNISSPFMEAPLYIRKLSVY